MPIITALTGQIETGRVAHAYLFTGTRGTGKTTCAKIFAKAVNCENPKGAEPCGECPCCVGIDNGSVLDVTEIDAASNNGVDDVRDLRDETAYRPSQCKYKVYIIDEVHMLSTAAFNALLKIMEEPPPHVLFVLATTEIHKVPPTILSRCQRFDFTRIDAALIAERLAFIAGQENIDLSAPAADLIARLADGALRDALSILDTCAGSDEAVDVDLVRRLAGVADRGYLFSVSGAIQQGDIPALLEKISELRTQSIDVKRLCEELIFHYRNILLALSAPDGALLDSLPPEEKQQYIEAAAGWNAQQAIASIRRLAGALDRMGRSPDPKIELELALFDLATPSAAAEPAARPVQAPMRPVAAPVAAPAVPAAPSEPEQRPVAVIPPAASPVMEVDASASGGVQPPEPPAAAPLPDAPPAAAPAAPSPLEADGAPGVYADWAKVVEHMAGVNPMLHSFMKGSTAYYDGRRMLIDGGEMFLSYMREYDGASAAIKEAIQQVTGLRCGIGPYTEKKQQAVKTARDTLKEWEEKGVPVEYT